MGIAKRLQAGTVWINQYDDFDTSLPFGGYKESGWGRDKGEYALENYMEVKTINFPINKYWWVNSAKSFGLAKNFDLNISILKSQSKLEKID